MASILSFINQAAGLLGNGLNRGCSFVLSCAGESIALPVIPNSYEVNRAYNNSSININSLGDINMLGKRGLTAIKFSSFFPAQEYSFAGIDIDGPNIYVKQLERFATKGQPCRLYISDTNINTWVTIDSLTYKEQDGTSDVYFDISLREYRYIQPTSDKLDATTQLASRVAETLQEKTVTFYPGMDLMDVAAQVVEQLFPISVQGAKQQKIFQELVKAGITVSNSLKITKTQLLLGDIVIKL